MSVGLACAVLGILVELGLDQMVAVAPWLIVAFVVGMLAAILGGAVGGTVAAILGVLAQTVAMPAWVPALTTIGGTGIEVDVISAVLALVVGLWIRGQLLVARPRTVAGPPLPGSVAGPTLSELAIVSAAIREFGAARTPAQVADALARAAASLSGAAGATVYLDRDGADGYLPLGRHGATDPSAPERLADGGFEPARAGSEAARGDFGRSGRPAALGVVERPIATGPATLGVLRLHGSEAESAPSTGPLIDILVRVAADAIERGRLRAIRRTAEADAAGAVGRVELLARLAAELVGGSTVEEVARTLVDLAIDDLAAGFAVVHVPDPETSVFRLVQARGYPAGLVASDDAIGRDGEVPVTLAARDGTIVEVDGEEEWRTAFPTASNVPAITGVQVITAIPMLASGRVHGVLTIGWRTAADRARADRDILAIAAGQGAQALERALLHALDEDARRFQEAFIGVVSHELRTPITTILAGSRLLRRRLDGDPQAADLSDDIEIEADRLSRIVDDLLVLSRLERRHLTIADEPIHLDHLLSRVVRSEAARWTSHEFAVRPSIGSHVVVGDETYVEQVLRNLMSNAAKYSPAGSTVELVIADAPDGDIHVGVLDEGPGVAPAEVDDLFSLFYRSPTTAASAAGAGIGLFVSRRLVAEMGGRMWAKPRPGGGSEFGFSLGRYPIDEAEFDGPLSSPAAAVDR